MGNEAMVVGLQYNNNEHNFPFGILPAKDFNEAYATINNLVLDWNPDALVVALDIPMHLKVKKLLDQRRVQIPYYAIFPLESPPLPLTWAMALLQMRGSMCMTKFGTEECHKSGLTNTKFIPIGIDQDVWKFVTPEERVELRKAFGYTEEDFVVLTVADNQERKNLTASMNIIARLKKLIPATNVRYNLVTREHLSVGYLLNDYAVELGIINNMSIFERGMPQEELWRLYAVADAFLLTSKSEGLGVPVLEAMSVGLPVVAINCCALEEHLQEGKNGYPIKIKCTYRDSFGNGFRYLVDEKNGAEQLLRVRGDIESVVNAAKEYVSTKSFQESAQILSDMLDKGALQ
jgi:glycosyltransferase involved in cell wall biosynthesis